MDKRQALALLNSILPADGSFNALVTGEAVTFEAVTETAQNGSGRPVDPGVDPGPTPPVFGSPEPSYTPPRAKEAYSILGDVVDEDTDTRPGNVYRGPVPADEPAPNLLVYVRGRGILPVEDSPANRKAWPIEDPFCGLRFAKQKAYGTHKRAAGHKQAVAASAPRPTR